ncbi:MAG: HNH endonuclease signature motif containing protein [Blastococcus sp.]
MAGTTLASRPTIAVVEELSGQLLALTDATGLRRAADLGRALGPPPATPGYVPSAALRAFVRARDRRCRFPGCRAAAIRCDLDHTTPWPVGPTSADNLCCLCRHHHRLGHQAPGWRLRHLPDGGLEWTTPGGQRITTHPPAYGTDDHPPPPTPPPPTLRDLVTGRPHPPGTHDPDPAPF